MDSLLSTVPASAVILAKGPISAGIDSVNAILEEASREIFEGSNLQLNIMSASLYTGDLFSNFFSNIFTASCVQSRRYLLKPKRSWCFRTGIGINPPLALNRVSSQD